MTGESGNFWHLTSGAWGVARATLAANIKALANCILKLWTSSPDCCAFWVMSTSSCWCSSSIPGAAGSLLPLSHSSLRTHIGLSNSVRSHWGGRNCCDFRSLISFCRLLIRAGWWHTPCTRSASSVY